MAQTSNGAITSPQIIDLPLEIPQADLEQARQQSFGARINLVLPKGNNQVAAGLWDGTARVGSFISRRMDFES